MPVPPQITSLGEITNETTIKPASRQWYEEEPTMEARKVEKDNQNPKDESLPTETVPQETTNTLIPNKELAGVVNTTEKLGQQAVTTISGGDPITSLADVTENEVIKEINSAHGTE